MLALRVLIIINIVNVNIDISSYNNGLGINPLSAKFIKWSNTLKQIVGKLPTICLSVFDHFSGLAFKGLNNPRFALVLLRVPKSENSYICFVTESFITYSLAQGLTEED